MADSTDASSSAADSERDGHDKIGDLVEVVGGTGESLTGGADKGLK